MGTQKGRVDVQQQPPSLLQTPQLPGAAPARPEVTRLLPTTRLRLALPLSISLLPPSFASRAHSVSLCHPLSFSCSSSPADSHTPLLSFTCVHTRGMMRVSSLSLSLSLSLTPSLSPSLSFSLFLFLPFSSRRG